MKQIKDILNNRNAVEVIEIFERNVDELDKQITALSAVVNALSFPKNQVKEKVSMEDLDRASETLERLESRRSAETIGPAETEAKNIQAAKAGFELSIEKCGPYRFVGKSVYFRNDWGAPHSIAGDICASLWRAKAWIFGVLDAMPEYHTDMPYAGGVYMWDRYDEKNRQQGYIIGKFMRADIPVPGDMDYYDIPEGYIAKGWGGLVEREVKEALRNSEEYSDASWLWSGEVYTDCEARAEDGSSDDAKTGYFIWCTHEERV